MNTHYVIERLILVDHEPDDPVHAWSEVARGTADTSTNSSEVVDQFVADKPGGAASGRYRVIRRADEALSSQVHLTQWDVRDFRSVSVVEAPALESPEDVPDGLVR